VQMVRNAVHLRPALPGDADASTLRLELTTITRPMIEENTLHSVAAAADPTIEEFYKENTGEEISEEEQRRLEWAGIHTIGQLRDLERSGGSNVLRRVAGVTPVERLRQALMKADSPAISDMHREFTPLGNNARRNLMRVRGRNLMQGGLPRVMVDGEAVRVVEAHPDQLLLEQPKDTGTISIHTAPGLEMAMAFELGPEAQKGHG
jgi:hypothetical protein